MLPSNRASTNILAGAYKNYSRERYAQLRKQHSTTRESEIVGRVIREWEAMEASQKLRYSESQSAGTIMLNVEPLATPLKDSLNKSNMKSTSAKEGAKRESLEMNLDDVKIKDFDLGSESKSDKSKKIAKKSKGSSDYISFFKYHFKKLQFEHKKWSKTQVSSIIALLWKKKKSISKTSHMKVR